MGLRRCWLLLIVLILLPLGSLFADPVLLDFEGFTDSLSLTNQYSGLTFTNAVVLTAGISLNEAEFPPFSGLNVIADFGGPITINFLAPILDFRAYFTYAAGLTLQAFSGGSSLNPVNSAFSANYTSSGKTPNELIVISSASGFDSVTITGDPGGGSFTIDDISYQTAPQTTPVPEPETITLCGIGIALLSAIHLHRRA